MPSALDHTKEYCAIFSSIQLAGGVVSPCGVERDIFLPNKGDFDNDWNTCLWESKSLFTVWLPPEAAIPFTSRSCATTILW
ncbi:hypothetical protein SBA4_1350002 [Candidatus Sulfopaludibacter sp. SbA4]|nr:hypothetical protein SBA4_1350002 [Candidatus Sulfopaludibacter sp. SbA4]